MLGYGVCVIGTCCCWLEHQCSTNNSTKNLNKAANQWYDLTSDIEKAWYHFVAWTLYAGAIFEHCSLNFDLAFPSPSIISSSNRVQSLMQALFEVALRRAICLCVQLIVSTSFSSFGIWNSKRQPNAPQSGDIYTSSSSVVFSFA